MAMGIANAACTSTKEVTGASFSECEFGKIRGAGLAKGKGSFGDRGGVRRH